MLVLAACRTAAPAKPATEGAAHAVSPPAVLYVPFSPKILVARDDEAFVLFHATVARVREGAPSFEIAYLASMNASRARAEDGVRRAKASAATLLETFGPLLPSEVRDADVTAVFGAPGTKGLGISAHVIRDARRWSASETVSLQEVLVPPLAPKLARPAQGEHAAVEAARTFLERADVGDGDGAWDLASAAVKATTSQRAFEEALWPDGFKPQPGGPRREWLMQYEVPSGDFTTGDHLLVCFMSERDLEAVYMRLDDDQHWRVANVGHPATAGERHAPSLPDTSSRSAARGSSSQDVTGDAP